MNNTDPTQDSSNASEPEKSQAGESESTEQAASSGKARRRRKRPDIDYTVPSPCVAVCEYDGSGLCKGCLRNSDEIREWMIMSADQKRAVLAQIESRKDVRDSGSGDGQEKK